MNAHGNISNRRAGSLHPDAPGEGLEGLLTRLEARCNDLILALSLAQESDELESRRAARLRRRLEEKENAPRESS